MAFIAASVGAIDYPEITSLQPGDPLFRQHQEDMRLYFLRSRSGGSLPPLMLYRYDASDHDSVLTVAARLNVPYSSIATLNGLTGTDLEPDGRLLLIPSLPGMFIAAQPRNHLDRLLTDLRSAEIAAANLVTIAAASERREFYFLPGVDFSPEERRSFLGALFLMPVDSQRITSHYGYRRHPITDVVQFHRGIDFAAPRGAPVRAAATGVVSRIGLDPLLGTFVVLSHRGGYETYYAHLERSLVTLNEAVGSGTIIGRVGTTGLTTGPHLHFEIREAGRPKDPLLLLPDLRMVSR